MSEHRIPTSTQLGCAIRRERRARRLSIEALALAADLHPTYLSAIERGLRNPTWGKLCSLARALDITISTLARAAEVETLFALADVLDVEPAALVQGTSDLDAGALGVAFGQWLNATMLPAPMARVGPK
ncbi:MAG: helix-turn-helix domain-containing protein [Solirubrobacteraceae bacterium]